MIDVSELMDDPDFVSQSPVLLVRRSNNANEYGEAEMLSQPFPITAIVQPATGAMLERLPDAVRYHDSIVLYSRAKFEAELAGGYADMIIYAGKRWLVQKVDDYSMWGLGYTRAIATFEGMAK